MGKFNFVETEISGLIVIEPSVFGDNRGFFMETYTKKDFQEAGIMTEFVQENHSKSSKGVLRGLHFQKEHSQAKLIRVIKGAVYDVAVDIRKGSPTYGKTFGIMLSAENKKELFVPKGFAHGFLTLEDDTEFLYKVDDYWYPEDEGGLAWNDSDIGIRWSLDEYGIKEVKLSDRDKLWPSFNQFESPFNI